MPKIGGKTICPECGSNSVTHLGGIHYEQTSQGMGHKQITTGYQCKDCNHTWSE